MAYASPVPQREEVVSHGPICSAVASVHTQTEKLSIASVAWENSLLGYSLVNSHGQLTLQMKINQKSR